MYTHTHIHAHTHTHTTMCKYTVTIIHTYVGVLSNVLWISVHLSICLCLSVSICYLSIHLCLFVYVCLSVFTQFLFCWAVPKAKFSIFLLWRFKDINQYAAVNGIMKKLHLHQTLFYIYMLGTSNIFFVYFYLLWLFLRNSLEIWAT